MIEVQQVPRNTIFYIKRGIGLLLLLALAVVFLFSGITKISDDAAFDAFQWTFLDIGINSATLAGIMARVLIGFELMVGAFLLCHIFLKQFTYPAAIVLIIMFIGYLTIVLIQHGNTGSCNCFGEAVKVKPLTQLRNDILMLAAAIILIYIYPVKPYKHQEWLGLLLGMSALVVPFIFDPLASNSEPETVSKPINLEALYTHPEPPSVDLRKGKHIIAFMSVTCPHCKKAAYLLQIIHRNNPAIPIFIVLNGTIALEKKFFDETKAEAVPHMLFSGPEAFAQMVNAGVQPPEKSGVPAIYWLNNSTIERKSTYYQLDPAYMADWMKK